MHGWYTLRAADMSMDWAQVSKGAAVTSMFALSIFRTFPSKVISEVIEIDIQISAIVESARVTKVARLSSAAHTERTIERKRK